MCLSIITQSHVYKYEADVFYPAEFLLLTNQVHALADRANDCGQVQNMTIRQCHAITTRASTSFQTGIE